MKIKPSTYIRNEYSELSSYCRETAEPVYITKNGEGDLAVMNIEAFQVMSDKIKEQAARIEVLEKIIEADVYNAQHPETYTFEEMEKYMEAYINDRSETSI